MLGMSQFEMGVAGIILFVISVAIAVYLITDTRGYGKESGEKTDDRLNITIDSRDFIGMDIKQIKTVFDGLEKMVKHNQEKQNNEK